MNEKDPKAPAPKSYVVRYQANQGDPLTLTADSFKVDGDVITFTTGGQPTAVVRGAWNAVTQNP
jgi:hypothetical protein